jgi:hypothetical protein
VPNDEELKRIEREIKDVVTNFQVRKARGYRRRVRRKTVTAMPSTMHIGAQDQDELMDKYNRCADALDLKFSD